MKAVVLLLFVCVCAVASGCLIVDSAFRSAEARGQRAGAPQPARVRARS
ncbi:MAG: hypothetical protein R3F62_20635 [Planctomycetota bacterium]